MMGFILGVIPSWLWLMLAAILVLIVVGVLKGDGWKWAFGIAGAAALLFLQSRTYQSGAASERAKQKAADDQARDTIIANRIEVQAMPEDQLNREVDRWTRK